MKIIGSERVKGTGGLNRDRKICPGMELKIANGASCNGCQPGLSAAFLFRQYRMIMGALFRKNKKE